MAMKRGLGRGFESLIPTDLIDDSFNPNSTYDPTASEDKTVSRQQVIALTHLQADADQPRKLFDEAALEELAESIKEHGVLQPLVVVPIDNTTYRIVAGERRFRAAQLAGLSEVPVVIRTLSDQHRLEISLIENIQRRDLNSIETATAYAKLRDQFNLTIEQIASRVHKSVSAISNTMRLLKLPETVIAAVADGRLTEGQVRPLVGQSADLIQAIVPRMIAEEWSARKVEQYIAAQKSAGVASNAQGLADGAQALNNRAEALGHRLQTSVSIRANQKGAGKIVISFKDAEELDRIQQLFG